MGILDRLLGRKEKHLVRKLQRALCVHCAGPARETLGWRYGIPVGEEEYAFSFVCEDHKGAWQALDRRFCEKQGLDYESYPDKMGEPVEVKCVLCLLPKGLTHADPNKGSWRFVCNDCEPRARELIEAASAPLTPPSPGAQKKHPPGGGAAYWSDEVSPQAEGKAVGKGRMEEKEEGPRRDRIRGRKQKQPEPSARNLVNELDSMRMELFRNTMSNWAKTKYPSGDAEHKRLARFINGLTGAPEDKAELPDGFDPGEWDGDKAVEATQIALERPELLIEAVVKNFDYDETVDFLLQGRQ